MGHRGILKLASVLAFGLAFGFAALGAGGVASAQVAVRAERIHTMRAAGGGAGWVVIENGVIIARDGKIAAIGPAAEVAIPEGMRVVSARVAVPGLIDARATVGLTGIFNSKHDSDQLEGSAPIQPELRAVDAYNPMEPLVSYVRSLGVTTVHTGHAPGELISGQTIIVKLIGTTVDEGLIRSPAMVAATLGDSARKNDKSPGTRGKMVELLRSALIRAGEYAKKRERIGANLGGSGDKDDQGRNLRDEALADVLAGKTPLMINAQRATDIASALRLAEEFKFRLVLDGAAESPQLESRIKAAGVPVIVHPPMQRAWGEMENASYTTLRKLREAGIVAVLQSGFESYVPKVRVVLFEAGAAVHFGLPPEEALAAISIDAARLLAIDDRVGSLEVGKDADVALFSGDPFEYTTHCVGTIINGRLVSEGEASKPEAGR
ncbi:MAG: amidohydrolase family protein [Planctomycetota bacterium]|nr:amidohydrolase family protein [Planctomycetota bacterium]